jgi:translation initiation factor 1 (eIF-1/SUI1)
MRRLRPLSEAECYARCYGGSDETVRVITLRRRERKRVVAVEGEALRVRFEQLLDARDPDAVAEPEAA